MEEIIHNLLEKLKSDQESLYNTFKDEVLIAYSNKQNKYKEDCFRDLQEIIENVSGIPNLFIKSRWQTYVAYRSLFDYILTVRECYGNRFIAKQTNRDHTTVTNSINKFDGHFNNVEYKENFTEITRLYLQTKSNTTN
jgi:hypothetical protein